MKPREHAELANYRELEVINTRLTQHERMVRFILLSVIVLGAGILGVLIYQLYSHPWALLRWCLSFGRLF